MRMIQCQDQKRAPQSGRPKIRKVGSARPRPCWPGLVRPYVTARTDSAALGQNLLLRFNNDSAGNYDVQHGDANATSSPASESFGQTSAVVGFLPGTTASDLTAALVCSIHVPLY